MTDAAAPETATAPDSLDLDGAARAIERILTNDGQSTIPRRRRQPADQAPTSGSGGSADADSGAPSPTDDESNAAPATEGDDELSDEQPGEQTDDGQPRYTVKVDGEAQEVTLDELVRGYQRNADYTRKTMKVAEERRELGRLREQVERDLATAEAERRQYTTELEAAIPALREQILQRFGGIDWAKLAAEDPVRFAEMSPVFETLSSQLQQAEAMRHRLRQQQRQREAELQRARLNHRNEQWRTLTRHLPELADPATARREVQAMTNYLLNAGYSRGELDRLVDHRDYILARKAMLYDRMTESKGRVDEQMRVLPKVQRPGAAPLRQDRGRERRAQLMNRLRRSGSTEDAARAIEELL
jgi:hypothetical protein